MPLSKFQPSYIVTNTTIFFVVYLLLLRHNYMFRTSMLAIFRLYMRNISISYTNVCGEFTVCGVDWVRDLVFVGEKGVDCCCLGNCCKVTFMSTYSYVYKWFTFLYVQCYIGNYIIYGLSLKCYGIVYTVLHIWVLLFTMCIQYHSSLDLVHR